MTSEEIIEKLLRKKHITPTEALIILKDIAKNTITKHKYSDYDSWMGTSSPIATMYGVTSTGSGYGGPSIFDSLDTNGILGSLKIDDSTGLTIVNDKTTNNYYDAVNSGPIK